MRLINGECLEEMAKLPDNSVDMVMTSPPYDNLRTYNQEGGCNWGEHVWKPCLEHIYRLLKTGGVCVWVVADATINGSETGTSFRQALHWLDIGGRLHDTMIWRKPNPMPRTHNRYEQAFEYMFILSKDRPSHWNPKMIKCKCAGKARGGTFQHNGDGVRAPKHKGGVCSQEKQADNVWDFAGGSKTPHPAEFPEVLISDHVSSWSNEGQTVLDPFMGSGTTGVACANLNREFIGIELDPGYFEIAKKRIADAITCKNPD